MPELKKKNFFLKSHNCDYLISPFLGASPKAACRRHVTVGATSQMLGGFTGRAKIATRPDSVALA